MKISIFVLMLISSSFFSQQNIFEYKESDYDNNEKIEETLKYINGQMKSFEFRIDKQYSVRMLLDKINFYERISEEILKEQDASVRSGLMKSIIISEEQSSKRTGYKVFRENYNSTEFLQVMKGTLMSMRRLTLKAIIEEYNHFLKSIITDK